MKVNLISAVLLFALAGCGKDKQSTDELVTINVNKDYPEKELILQDIMEWNILRWKRLTNLSHMVMSWISAKNL